jgi:ParB family chromosome partitioning protein
MTDTLAIALNKLTAWKGNVRKTGAKDGIDELAASIATHGLLQSLVVRPAKADKYELIAGRRRYLALQSLAKAGTIAKDYPVACTLASDEIDASELSLAENVVRMSMHPADQFEAFRTVIEKGAGIADVAARFGVSETIVTKRLRLGRLSPVILSAYREGRIDLEEAQAFAITEDHAAQERVLTELSDWRLDPQSIRRALTETEVPASDKRVRFIGLEAYETAGGSVRRDLFDDANGGYAQDAELLERLVTDKLSAVAAEVSGEGWSFVHTMTDLDYQALAEFTRVSPERADLSDADQAELDALSAEYDRLVDSEDYDASECLDELQRRMDALTERSEYWPAETLAVAGAVIGLSHDGSVRIERGLVRKSDAKALRKAAKSEKGEPANALPASLIEDLTAQRSAAIGAELIRQPDIALSAMVHAMTLQAFYDGAAGEACVEIGVREANLARLIKVGGDCPALAGIEAERERLASILPESPDALWPWMLSQPKETLLDILGFIAAISVNAVQGKGTQPGSERLTHAHALAGALGLDMTRYFTASAEGYFGRVSRSVILSAIDEAHGAHAPALEKLKKSELAVRAADLVANTGWLPEPLRPTHKAAA